MLTPTQISAAHALYQARPLRVEHIRAVAALTTFDTVEDRAEWFSRTGYSAAYGATALGIAAEARFPVS